MDSKIDQFKKLLAEKLPKETVLPTKIKGLTIFRRDSPYQIRPQLYNPQIIIIAQGKKRVFLGDKTYIYDPDHYYVQTLPLPVKCEAIIENGKPMLGMVLTIDPRVIGEILFEMESDAPSSDGQNDSLYSSTLSATILDGAIRLLETLDSPDSAKILGPIFFKEILFKVLTGENGDILRASAINNQGFYRISRVIYKIHEEYSQPVEIQNLAKEAGMSSTAFYSLFKEMTTTSPLQYIKNVRLHKAKEMIRQEGEKANTAAMRVGYESSSQFSREYKRCFGVTPAKDREAAISY